MVSTDGFPDDRANRIADAVEEIEENVTRLRELQSMGRDEYTASENQDVRDAVERKFEKLTEAVLDISREISKQERGRVPNQRMETISSLVSEGVVGQNLGEKLRQSVGFRDVLSHSYGPIIDDDIVYNALQNELERYVSFVEAVEAYLHRFET